MANRVHTFEVTIPAGTLESSPQDTPLPFPVGDVTNVEILIPPGPSGLVGFAFRHSGGQIIPYDPGSFIVADGEVIRWPLEGFPTGDAWSLSAFNTDVYEHKLFIRFLVTETVRERSEDTFQPLGIPPGGQAPAEGTSTNVDALIGELTDTKVTA